MSAALAAVKQPVTAADVAKGFARVKARGRGRDTGNALHDGPRPAGPGGGDIPALTCLARFDGNADDQRFAGASR